VDTVRASDAATTPRTRAYAICGAAALAAVLVYLNALHNPFLYDDYRTVAANRSLESVGNWRAILLHDVARPLVNVTYALDFAVGGSTPSVFHSTNVLLHAVNVVLLFVLATRLGASNRLTVGGTAAALLAVHPMMTEAVGYISGRPELLCGLFLLLALMSGRAWLGGPTRWAIPTVLCWGAAGLSKETGVMFPVLLFAFDRLVWTTDDPSRRRRLRRVHLPLAVVAAAVVAARMVLLLRVEQPAGAAVHWPYLLIAVDVVWRYVGLLVVPHGQTIFHVVDRVGLLTPRGILDVVLSVAAVASVARLRRAAPAAAFGLVWFFTLLVPSSVLIALDVGEPMAEHRVYAASFGLFVAAGVGVAALWRRVAAEPRLVRTAAAACGVLVLIAFAADTVVRNAMWASGVALWSEAAAFAPAHYRPRLLLGEALHDDGRRDEAADQFALAIRLRPSNPTGYVRLGQCLAERGEIDRARGLFEEALRLDPADAAARQSLLLLDRATGRRQ
jgi:hypothetical protein